MKNIVLERDDMSDFELGLFLKDMQKVLDEYFEAENPSVEITRSDGGFLVCVLFTARRGRSLKKPL